MWENLLVIEKSQQLYNVTIFGNFTEHIQNHGTRYLDWGIALLFFSLHMMELSLWSSSLTRPIPISQTVCRLCILIACKYKSYFFIHSTILIDWQNYSIWPVM